MRLAPTQGFPRQGEGDRPENVEKKMRPKDNSEDETAFAPIMPVGKLFSGGNGCIVVNGRVIAVLIFFTQSAISGPFKHLQSSAIGSFNPSQAGELQEQNSTFRAESRILAGSAQPLYLGGIL